MAQLDTVDRSTVSRQINKTTVRHDVALNPGKTTNRGRLGFVIMLVITPPIPNIFNIFFFLWIRKKKLICLFVYFSRWFYLLFFIRGYISILFLFFNIQKSQSKRHFTCHKHFDLCFFYIFDNKNNFGWKIKIIKKRTKKLTNQTYIRFNKK